MLLTIRARVNEAVKSNGIGFPESVTVSGAGCLSPSTVQEIAQEAVDNMYGSYESGYRAVYSVHDKMRAEANGTADAVTVKVEELDY